MIGPIELTHIVYVFLIVVFVGIMTYMVVYNLRVRARQRQLLRPGETIHNTPGSIAAATESLEHDKHKR